MENNVLSSALGKILEGESSAVSALSDNEARSLSIFLSAQRVATDQSEADQLLCRNIRVILQERSARLNRSDPDTVFQRTNLTLRAAIDLFLVREYTSVLVRDLELLRETRSRLQAMEGSEESSPNHVRLFNLIGECLNAYAAWISEHPEVTNKAPLAPPVVQESAASPQVVADTTDSATGVEARAFLSAAGIRETVPTLEGIPLGASVRVLVHEGNLQLKGELSDEFLLDVRGGSLEVDGGIFGFVVADGDIIVHGSVQGGWLFSRRGNIHAARILAGSTLIAPQGDIAAGSVENPRIVYCGNDFSSEQGVRSGTYFVRNFRAAEGVKNSRINLRGSLSAQSIESAPQEDTAGIQFRLAQTCFDFGRPVQDGPSTTLRNFGRIWYRRRVAAALQDYLESEILAIQRFRIFAMQSGGVEASAIAPIRHAQCERALLPVLLRLGEGLKELMVLGENIGLGMESALITTGVDESTACLGIVAKEIKMLCRSFVRDKEVLEAPCRHIASFAKKLKDTLRLGQGADKLLSDFDFRMDEWRVQIERAAAELEAHERVMSALLGPTVWQVTEAERLTALLGRMIHAAEDGAKLPRVMQSREMNALREHVEQHTANRVLWRSQLEGLRGEFDESLKTLGESINLVVSDGGEEAIHTETFGPGVRIQTLASIKKISGSNGAMVFVTGAAAGSPKSIHMRNLRLYPEREEVGSA